MPIDFAGKEVQRWRENAVDVPRAVKAGELNLKITNYCERFGYSEDEVRERLKSDHFLQAWFAKDPKKQNIHEHTAAEFIKRIKGISNFRNLPNNEKAISNGGVIPKKELKKTGGRSTAKTIDFEWNYGHLECYAYHKYTHGEGGSQDSALRDLQAFIREARGSVEEDRHFFILADGSFYDGKGRNKKRTRLEELQDEAGGVQIHSCKTEDLEEVLKRIAAKRQN